MTDPGRATVDPQTSQAGDHDVALAGRRAQRLTADDRAKLDRIFEHAPIGIQVISADGRYLRVNPAFCHMTGYTAAELAGYRVADLADYADAAASSQRLQELPRRRGDVLRYDRRYVRKDGTVMQARLTASVLSDDSSDPASVIVLVEDVTDERQLREARERAVTELEEAGRRQQELSALRRNMVSALGHEMRTPLTVMLGFADLLLDGVDGPLSEGQQDAVTAIRDAALRELQLLDDALALARARSGTAVMEAERLDMVDMVAHAVAETRDAAFEKGIDITFEYATEPLWVHADPAQLRRAVDHLLANAVKFTPEGQVAVRCTAREGDAVFEVRDTGIGIADADLAAIFDEFRQLDQGPTRRYGGVGLGLALVRTLVEAHSGRVGVTSSPGNGSNFTVTLPLVAA
jgi:PAS domain S-box-containing protein